jgi:hypothetical protein
MTEQHRCYHEGSIAELKANMKAAFQRIDEQREQGEALIKLTDSMHTLAITVATMAEKMETIIKTVSKVEANVARLESVPIEDYRHYKRQWIGGAIMLVIGGVIGAMLQLVMI